MNELARRLEPLRRRWELSQASVSRLEQLLVGLARDPQAPTAVKNPLRGVDVHIADSLSGLEVSGFRALDRIVDIGSGVGFPGVALAIAMPQTHFDLLEASSRKCAFLERTTSALKLDNVDVICRRAEEWVAEGGAESYGGAVTRAVGLLPTLLEYAAPLLATGGLLVAWKGRRDPHEEECGIAAGALLGLQPLAVDWVGPFAGSRNRHLYSYRKVASCPPGFPRRPGMARKRPLGENQLGSALAPVMHNGSGTN